MDREFCKVMMEKTGFPPEAKEELLKSWQTLQEGQEAQVDTAVDFFYDNSFDVKKTQSLIDDMAEKTGLSPYTVWMIVLIEAAKRAKPDFAAHGMDEELFYATFSDLRYKALECKEIHGVWGTFVAFWYPIFFSCDLVKLGRLEYESCTYPNDEPYVFGDITIKKGDPVKSIHIPSSGEPFDEAARMESYRKAYDFFAEERKGGPLVCICHSWLLYPEYRPLLSEKSNTLAFMGDFDIISQDDEEKFGDAWRLFGREHTKPTEQWPENTSMRRAYKQHFLSGGKAGEGFGVLLFDGEKIINRK